MPVVPTYGDRQVRTAPLQPVFQNTPDVSSGTRALAQGLGQLGEAVDRIGLRDAQAKASDVEARITTEWMKWDTSKEGRAKYRGENADGYAPAAEAWWEEARKTFGKDLDPRAGALASRSLQAKRAAAINGVLSFTASEKERHADETYAADVNTTIQFGITTGEVAGTAQQIREKAAVLGQRKGWTTEQVQAEAGKNLSQMHLAQITKLSSENAGAAQKYYDENKAEVGFQNQARVEQVLKAEGDNQFATQEAARVAALPLDAQLAEAAKIEDPQRREKTLSQIKNNHAMVKEAERAQQEKLSDAAWQLVGQGKRVPEAILAGMDGKERVQLQDHLRAKAERAMDRAAGRSVKTDPVIQAKIYDMMRDDPEGFKKLRMETLTPFMSGNDIEQVARLQRDANKPDTEKDVATTTQLMGVYTGGWKPEKRSAFQATAYDELHRAEKDKGKPLTYEDKKKILDRLVLDGEVMSGSLFLPDPNKKFYEATPEERARFSPTITSSDRKLVRAALEAEGVKNPTEAQVLERFKLAKGIR